MSDVNYIAEDKPNPGNERDAQCSICGATLVCLSCGNHRDRMSETKRWKLGHAWNGVGQMDASPDGEYVLFTDHEPIAKRERELEEALRELLSATSQEECDDSCTIDNCPWMQARAALKEPLK